MKSVSYFLFLAFFLGSALLLFPKNSLAKTDLSITATDITFSKEEPVEGEGVRIFARVFNLGESDVYGFVVFLKNNKEMADPQPISVKTGTYDDVFIDWTAASGDYNIQAKIINTALADDNPGNNTAVQENYFIDSDSDKDGIGNKKDLDDDNDGLSDEQEQALSTDSLNPDTDKDKVRDNVDPFPLDSSEWQDADKDALGDNSDADDDNDGLSDEEELFFLGTNPSNADSDQDGFSDKKEDDLGTNPIKDDSDGDGVIDSKDGFPLDFSRSQASMLEALKTAVKDNGWSVNQVLIAAFGLFMVFMLIIYFKKRK